jgi:hypothetical protein
MPINKTAIAKQITSWTVGAGVGTIVHAIVRNNTQPALTLTEDGELQTEKSKRSTKVTVPAASFVVTLMAKEACSDYTDAKIDEVVAWWNKHVNKIEPETPSDTEK